MKLSICETLIIFIFPKKNGQFICHAVTFVFKTLTFNYVRGDR